MTSRTRALSFSLALAAAGLWQGSALLAQGAGPVPRPGLVETAPLAPPPGNAPAAPQAPPATAQAPAPAPAVPPAAPAPATPPAAPPSSGSGAAAARPTLVPNPGDPVDVDEVTLPGKPAAIIAGTSTWDDGFENLKNAFRRIEEELTRAGIAPAGRPLTVFLQTDDMSFRYEAMVPIADAPAGRPTMPPEIRFGQTPAGRALRFVHKGPYDDIDSTYETITAYLDTKGIVAQDQFVEEYVTDLTETTDESLEINVFALPK